jgi:hypothetical protein
MNLFEPFSEYLLCGFIKWGSDWDKRIHDQPIVNGDNTLYGPSGISLPLVYNMPFDYFGYGTVLKEPEFKGGKAYVVFKIDTTKYYIATDHLQTRISSTIPMVTTNGDLSEKYGLYATMGSSSGVRIRITFSRPNIDPNDKPVRMFFGGTAFTYFSIYKISYDWKVIRLLWIANKKESKETCQLATLPLDIIRVIISILNEVPKTGEYATIHKRKRD